MSVRPARDRLSSLLTRQPNRRPAETWISWPSDRVSSKQRRRPSPPQEPAAPPPNPSAGRLALALVDLLEVGIDDLLAILAFGRAAAAGSTARPAGRPGALAA